MRLNLKKHLIVMFSVAACFHAHAQIIAEIDADTKSNTFIAAQVGMPTVIEFESNVTEVIVSGTGDWKKNYEIEKFNSKILIKPFNAVPINLVALTDNGSFSLVVTSSPKSNNSNYQTIVRLKKKPIDNTAAILAALAASKEKADKERHELNVADKQKKINDFLVSARVKNTNYTVELMTENPSIVPETVYDDGVFTYIKFRKNQKPPTIYEFDFRTGEETMLNFHTDDEGVFVIQGLVRTLMLRRGKEELALHNELFNINGTPTAQGTSQATQRIVKK